MPYVDRDAQGRIVGIYACEQREGQEYVDGEVALWIQFDQAGGVVRAKDKRKLVLDALAGIAGRLQRAGDLSNALACDQLSVQLLAIDLKAIAQQAADDDDFDNRVLVAYRTLAAGAPAVVAAAFGELA